ncbi:MAG: hypothetical protein E7293_10510 [Lachnospiraceae bacterium]|nr:hypothetical protein [Lachnospiraceae bacterium]
MSADKFSEKLFQNPTKEYRGAPFWAWNGKLDKEVLREQMEVLRQMGFGGYNIHSRIGLATPYLGEEFMDCVRFCNEYGKEHDMLTWLYDEDKWPSGYGGGFVTGNVEYRARYLLFSPHLYPQGHLDRNRPAQNRLTENGEITLLARYEIRIEEGRLVQYRLLEEGETAPRDGMGIWYAYEVIGDQLPWFNNAAYVDTLNPEAIECFAKTIHEKYKEWLREDFGGSIPAMFTDEPQFSKMLPMKDGMVSQEANIPYTRGIDEAFGECYGYGFFQKLPEVFWEKADGTLSEMKYRYHDWIAQRFAEAYAGTLGAWCAKNNLMFTGHVMYEDTLERQSQCVGDAMRSYPHFQLPGVDVLAAGLEYNTVKQAQSVARQEGKPGVLSELYGVTNWDYDFRGHKLQGDWQAALGVTARVPHLAWMCMGGEAKRDYPAPIDAHSPWYQKYSLIEDHFSRINTVMRRGKAAVRVAVVHPIESYWMLFGPERQTLGRRKSMDERFSELTRWLLFNLLDFDFLSEGLLPDQKVRIERGRLCVGEMAYEAVVVPKLLTMRRSTLDILKAFQEQGGKVILLGQLPDYVDAKFSRDAKSLEERAVQIGFDKEELLSQLQDYRDMDICTKAGARTDCLIYQLREEEADKWLFVAHGKPEEKLEVGRFQQLPGAELYFAVRGKYAVCLLDTMTGDIQAVSSRWEQGNTVFTLPCYGHDSFLFRLKSVQAKQDCREERQPAPEGKGDCGGGRLLQETYLSSTNPYTLEESNTLLLDQAGWRLDGGVWMPVEEVLQLDDQVRKACGMRLRTDSFPQPWLSEGVNEKEHVVELRFAIPSEIRLDHVELAFEGDTDVELEWNGEKVAWREVDYFVDRCIHRISLGALSEGENMLRMRIPFGVNTNLEWCYLLGEFGVRVAGRNAVIIRKPETIGFGDYAIQGLSFYGGNLVYETTVETQAGQMELEVADYSAPLLGITLDEGEEVPLFMEPYRVNLGKVEKGTHKLRIRSYGSRINQFGQVHNCNLAERYFGPTTWRTTGKKWCYEYRLKKCGVLTAPILRIYQD